MRFLICVFLVLSCLSAFSSPCIAADKAQFKCNVRPPQAETWGIRTIWNGEIRQKLSVNGYGKWQKPIPFRVGADGYTEHWFNRPSKGCTLEAIIRIKGGRGFHDSEIRLTWLSSQKEPEVWGPRNAQFQRITGHSKYVAAYGVIFNMHRKQ